MKMKIALAAAGLAALSVLPVLAQDADTPGQRIIR